MTATFVQEGSAIDYTPGADVASGAVVVQGELVGVSRSPIKANQLGALAVEGEFDFPKATGGGTAIPAGSVTYWDVGNELATLTPGSGDPLLGKSVLAAGDNDATVRVRLSQ